MAELKPSYLISGGDEARIEARVAVLSPQIVQMTLSVDAVGNDRPDGVGLLLSRALLQRLGADFTPDTLVDNLSIAQRQMVEIAKALSIDARVIIMDEPTSSLTISETERLLEVIADLTAHGISVIYISHRLGEIMTCADRVVVLRDGRTVGELARDELSHVAMIRLMIGRDLKELYTPPKRSPISILMLKS